MHWILSLLVSGLTGPPQASGQARPSQTPSRSSSSLTRPPSLPGLQDFAPAVPSAWNPPLAPHPCSSCRCQLRPASPRKPSLDPSPGAGAPPPATNPIGSHSLWASFPHPNTGFSAWGLSVSLSVLPSDQRTGSMPILSPAVPQGQVYRGGDRDGGAFSWEAQGRKVREQKTARNGDRDREKQMFNRAGALTTRLQKL